MKNVNFYPDYFEANGYRYKYRTPRGRRLYLEMIAEVKAIKIVRPIIEDALKYVITTDCKDYIKGLEMTLAILDSRMHDTERDIDTFSNNSKREV